LEDLAVLKEAYQFNRNATEDELRSTAERANMTIDQVRGLKSYRGGLRIGDTKTDVYPRDEWHDLTQDHSLVVSSPDMGAQAAVFQNR
ncbi:hypothetical protein LTR43_011582, partial [Exophiala xenobiotica]